MNDSLTGSRAPRRQVGAHVQSHVIIACPYEVRVDGFRRGKFDDLRDAISSAQIAKRENGHSTVSVTDTSSGQIVIEIDV